MTATLHLVHGPSTVSVDGPLPVHPETSCRRWQGSGPSNARVELRIDTEGLVGRDAPIRLPEPVRCGSNRLVRSGPAFPIEVDPMPGVGMVRRVPDRKDLR